MSLINFKVHHVKGVQDLQKKLRELGNNAEEARRKAVQDAVFLIHATAVNLIQDNSSGVPQKRYTNGKSRMVLASKPGDPPNTDTGRLVQSIKFEFSNDYAIGSVGTNLKYGKHLEYGTRTMAARPWLSRAIRICQKDIEKMFRAAINKVVKEAGR